MVGGKALADTGCGVGGRPAEAGLPWLQLLCGWLPAARLSSLAYDTVAELRGRWMGLPLCHSSSNSMPAFCVPCPPFCFFFVLSHPHSLSLVSQHQSPHLVVFQLSFFHGPALVCLPRWPPTLWPLEEVSELCSRLKKDLFLTIPAFSPTCVKPLLPCISLFLTFFLSFIYT